MILRAQFQMLILALHLTLHSNSTPGFNLVLVLVQDLLLQRLPKLTAPLDNVRRSYIQCIYINEEKTKLFPTGLFSLLHFIQFSFVKFWFC